MSLYIATNNVPLISEHFTLFLVFFTPVGIALFSSCFSELGRQLLPAYCHFIRSSEITRDSLVLFWQPGHARSKDWKYSLSPTVQNEKFTFYPVLCFNTDVRDKHTNWTFRSMQTELTLLPPRFQKY